MADALDSESSDGYHRVGSTPIFGTRLRPQFYNWGFFITGNKMYGDSPIEFLRVF